MQRVGVSIRLSAQDAANVEQLCTVREMKVSDWYRQVIEKALDEDWQKYMKQKEDKE